MDIVALVAKPEGKQLERKGDASLSDAILRTVVAFANTAGGSIVVGVGDDGTVVGVDDPISVEERLANLITHGVSPLVVPDLSMATLQGRTIVVVTVHPSGRRPHHVAVLGSEHGTFIRLGASNRIADHGLREELVRLTARRGFDEEPAPDVPLSALDTGQLPPGTLKGPAASALRTLELTATIDGVDMPTNAGVLLLGREVISTRFPDASVHALAFDTEGTLPRGHRARLRRMIAGCILEMVEATHAFVNEVTGDRVQILPDALPSERTSVVPQLALRELVVNAFVHADYSLDGSPFRVAVFRDRVEIENPGLLLPGLTVEDLGHGVSRIRNRAIARVFREVGLIEQWGSGIARANEACEAAGLPAPQFEEFPPYRFRATIYTVPVTTPELDELEQRLLDLLAGDSDGVNTASLARMVERSERTVRNRLARLVNIGLVAVEGAGPRRRYVLPR